MRSARRKTRVPRTIITVHGADDARSAGPSPCTVDYGVRTRLLRREVQCCSDSERTVLSTILLRRSQYSARVRELPVRSTILLRRS